MIDQTVIEQLKNIDLLTLIGSATTLQGSQEKYGPCPACGGTDRFHVKDNCWFCSHCTGRPDDGGWKDTIDYVRLTHNVGFEEACQLLCNQSDIPTVSEPSQDVPQSKSAYLELPDFAWQCKACAAVIITLCGNLFSETGSKARDWLKGRGINEDAMAHYNLGYTTGGFVQGIEFNGGRGIVIPHYYERTKTMAVLKVRCPVAEGAVNKYYCVKGSKPSSSLYNADSLIGQKICFVTEGEFDTIALHSHVRDLAAVITLGSKTAKLAAYWLPYLMSIKRFYIATDANEDEQAANYWLNLVGNRGQRVLPPGGCKDVCEAAMAGHDLRAWALKIIRLDETRQEHE